MKNKLFDKIHNGNLQTILKLSKMITQIKLEFNEYLLSKAVCALSGSSWFLSGWTKIDNCKKKKKKN